MYCMALRSDDDIDVDDDIVQLLQETVHGVHEITVHTVLVQCTVRKF